MYPLSLEEARVRVERGAVLCDTYRPGWAGEIDLDRLNLSSGFDCVLGQLFPESSCLIPRWKAFGSFYNGECSDDQLRYLASLPNDVDDVDELVCIGNYRAGAAVITDFLRDKGSDEPRQTLLTHYGFVLTNDEAEDFSLLDIAWAEEVVKRRG